MYVLWIKCIKLWLLQDTESEGVYFFSKEQRTRVEILATIGSLSFHFSHGANWKSLKLSWDCHVDTICKKVTAGIGAIWRINNFVPVATLGIFSKGLVQLYFQYCSPLWDTCGKLLKDKLQRFQSRAARVLTGASYDIRSADLIDSLSRQTLDDGRRCAKLFLMYKILNDNTFLGLRPLLWEGMSIRLITIYVTRLLI